MRRKDCVICGRTISWSPLDGGYWYHTKSNKVWCYWGIYDKVATVARP